MFNVLQQHLTGNTRPTDAAVVTRLGAIQAQDYANARWWLGLRMQGATDATIEEAFNSYVS
jgi:hypothetical protein